MIGQFRLQLGHLLVQLVAARFLLCQPRGQGRFTDDEMFGTFNMGLGMIVVVDPQEAPKGEMVVGEVVPQSGPDRVVIS